MYRITIGVETDDSVFTAQIERIVMEHKMFAIVEDNPVSADLYILNGYRRKHRNVPFFIITRPGTVRPEWVDEVPDVHVMEIGTFTESDLADALESEITKIISERTDEEGLSMLSAKIRAAQETVSVLTSEITQISRYQKLLVDQAQKNLSLFNFESATYYKPLATASGDVIMAFPYGDTVYMMLADATNHGAMAAVTASMLRTSAYMYFYNTPMQKTNIRSWAQFIIESFEAYSTGSMVFDAGKLTSTATLVSINKTRRKAEFVFFGTVDLSPILIHNNKVIPILAGVDLPKILPPIGDLDLSTSVAQGSLSIVEDFSINSIIVDFNPGDSLILYSDGLPDVKKDCENFFDQSERYLNDKLVPILQRVASDDATADDYIQTMIKDAAAFSTTQSLLDESVTPESTDDVTIFSIKWPKAKEEE